MVFTFPFYLKEFMSSIRKKEEKKRGVSFGSEHIKARLFLKDNSFRACPLGIKFLIFLALMNDKNIYFPFLVLSLILDSGISYCFFIFIFHVGGLIVGSPTLRAKYTEMYGPQVFFKMGWNPVENIKNPGKAAAVIGGGFLIIQLGNPVANFVVNETANSLNGVQWMRECDRVDIINARNPEAKYPYPPKPPVSTVNLAKDTYANIREACGLKAKVEIDTKYVKGKAAFSVWEREGKNKKEHV